MKKFVLYLRHWIPELSVVSVPLFLRTSFLNKDHVTQYSVDDIKWFRSCIGSDSSLKEVIKNV